VGRHPVEVASCRYITVLTMLFHACLNIHSIYFFNIFLEYGCSEGHQILERECIQEENRVILYILVPSIQFFTEIFLSCSSLFKFYPPFFLYLFISFFLSYLKKFLMRYFGVFRFSPILCGCYFCLFSNCYSI
jgi:hypothetical protein